MFSKICKYLYIDRRFLLFKSFGFKYAIEKSLYLKNLYKFSFKVWKSGLLLELVSFSIIKKSSRLKNLREFFKSSWNSFSFKFKIEKFEEFKV